MPEIAQFLERKDARAPRIAFWLAEPAGEPRGAVLLTHGYAEHSGRYAEVVRAWTDRGLLIARWDLRGHGVSEGPRGHVESFRDYVRDAEALLDKLAENERWRGVGKPVLFGHSLGGLITLHVALARESRYRGVALTSPLLGLALAVPAHKRFLAQALSGILPRFALPSGISASELTHDEAIVRIHEADPLVFHHATARWFTEMLTAQEDAFTGAPQLGLPVLCLAAGDDKIASTDETRTVFEVIGSRDKELRVIPDRYHELLNEPERAEHIEALASQMLAWSSG